MQIGEVAKRTGLTVKAIRHYEARGLLGAVPRRRRYRAFGPQHLERLEHIRRAKELGMTLREIRGIFVASPAVASDRALAVVEAKIRERADEIRRAEEALKRLRAVRAEILECVPGAA